ncbi:triose-phosphate isomerase [Risungbinella massiliensis]|uniref:triose-phosphate isomerase n=1 Tax=Risungbinella massiliensis TaxID=1329796 RepID=UPI0005CB8FA9|nr:triose-phosphate isomerase [Risungbinella massiliensis]
MRTPVIAGNWKMFKTLEETKAFFQELGNMEFPSQVEAVVCAPFLSLPWMGEHVSNKVGVGAQNCHFETEGAYTGEISLPMLQTVGAKYVILGHSERRQYFAETDEVVNQKVRAVIAHQLVPILCVGESLAEKEANRTNEVVKEQVVKGLADVSADDAKKAIIAYEPVWAIGSGKAATAEDAEEVIGYIRQVLAEIYDQTTADAVRIQYGGSVKPENIATFLAQPNIDGALVGGASLKAESYAQLVQNAVQGGK